jgi:glycerophosphoryl diester phosphodiesterase
MQKESKSIVAKEYRNNKKMIVAHRGASAYIKENSIGSFIRAIDIGADMIEFDIRRTRDCILIVHHDENVDKHLVKNLTYEQIRIIDADIPAVEEIFRLTKGKIKLDVELKEEGYEEEVVELLLKYFREDEFVITSFNDRSLKIIKSGHPKVKVGLILGKEKPEKFIRTRYSELFPIKRAKDAKADFLVPHWKLLRFGFLKRAKRNKMPVFVWTVNDEKEIEDLLNNDLIKAIITDRPEIAISLQKRITSIGKR